jgi:DNA-binding response OmpR family regulator
MQARILIVEDDQIIAADLRLKLERLGHAVIGIASSGEEAIAMAKQSKVELVLMDIRLETAMSGTEAARAIQESTDASIIFVTAFSGASFPDETLSQRICLKKPFSRVQLEAAVETALRTRSQRHHAS